MVERIRALLEIRQLTPTQFADLIGVARPIISHVLSGRNKPSLEVVQRILAAMPDLAMPWLLNGTGPMLATGSAAAATSPADIAGPPATSVAAAPAPAVATNESLPTSSAPLGSPSTVQNSQSATAPATTYAPRRMSAPSPANTPRAKAPFPSQAQPKRFTSRSVTAATEALAPDAPVLPSPQPVSPLQKAVAVATPPLAAPPLATPEDTPLASAPVSAPLASPAVHALPEAPAVATSGASLASVLLAGEDKSIRRIVIFYHDGSFADYRPE